MNDRIRGEVRAFIVREFLDGDGRDLDDRTPLLRTGILDSLKIVTLLAFLEASFRVAIETHQVTVANFSTIQQIAELVMMLSQREVA